jgi:hypothetical protein
VIFPGKTIGTYRKDGVNRVLSGYAESLAWMLARSLAEAGPRAVWGRAGDYLSGTARAGGRSSAPAYPVVPERIGEGLNPLTMR